LHTPNALVRVTRPFVRQHPKRDSYILT